MFNFIKKMQGQPIEVRRRFALLVSAVITGIIFIIWLSARLSATTTAGVSQDTAASPFDSVGAAVSTFYEEGKGYIDLFNQAKEEIKKQK